MTAAAVFTHKRIFPALPPASSPDSPGIIENLSDLEKVGVLGHGDNGINGSIVYKVRHKNNSCIYALKVLRFDNNASTGILQQAAREAEILKLVDSPYVIRCHGVFDNGAFMSPDHNDNEGQGDLCFVMEYMEGGSLQDVLRARHRLPEQVISGVAKCVLHGLHYLHAMQTQMPETASSEFRSFIWRCLEKDWRKRAKVDELLDHPFVNKTCCPSTDQELN